MRRRPPLVHAHAEVSRGAHQDIDDTAAVIGVDAAWEARMGAAWEELDNLDEAEFLGRIDQLAAELPSGSAVALFERGAARDSTGHPEDAVPLYKSALEAGLGGQRRRRAVIQLASSTRNLGDPREALRLLSAEAAVSDALDGAVATFTALALADLGRDREALAVALTALANTLPRYNRSATRYARALIGADAEEPS